MNKENREMAREGMSQAEKEDRQFACIYGIMRRNEEHLSIEEMSEKLISEGFKKGASTKTIYRRILPKLIEYGAQKDDQNKYFMPERLWKAEYEKKYAREISEQMETELIISNFLETLKGSPFYEQAKNYIDGKFRMHKMNLDRHRGAKPKDGEYISRVIFMGAPAANVKNEIWETIHTAIKNNYYIKLKYKADDKKRSQVYTVKPFQLIFDNGFWDLWGESTTFDHRGRRLFNLSRIIELEIPSEKEKFDLPDNYDFRYTLEGNFGCYNDDVSETYRLKIKKDSYAYSYIKDRIWGDYQEITETKDGWILEFEATQYKPIFRWVLSWGNEMTPLEPERLVEEWKDVIRDLYKNV